MNEVSIIAIWHKRLINYIIDFVCIIIITLIIIRLSPYLLRIIPFDFEFKLNINFLIIFVYIAYYVIFEAISGNTIGKYLTNTKVINYHNCKPSIGKILIRTLVRLTLIEILSYLKKRPTGWHDSLSSTEVVEKKKINKHP
jgi:uncharacterized RDD family membrane protein YckC